MARASHLGRMRALFLALAVLAPAAPAAAQDAFALQHMQNELLAQQQMLQQRSVAQSNELMALEARLRTEQSLTDLIIQRQTPRLPGLEVPRPPPVAFDTSSLLSIPDDRLAASNAAVREASKNRR